MTAETAAPIPHWPGEFIALAGSRIHVRRAPPAPAAAAGGVAVFVHGLGGSSRNWTDLMGLLRDRLDCVALDLPGYGESPPRPDGRYSITAFARTVTDFIENQNAGPVHLIGNSMGGAIAVRAAARRPDLVRTLTLVAPALPDYKPRLDLLRFPVVSLPRLGEFLIGRYQRVPADQRVSAVLAACYHDVSLVQRERYAVEVAAQAERDAMPHAIAALAGSIRALTAEQVFRCGPLSPWREAGRITAPTLVIYGTDDILVRARMAVRARKTFRYGKVVVLPDTGHVAQMECPQVVADLIAAMLDREQPVAGRG